jgi:hypothetical protein
MKRDDPVATPLATGTFLRFDDLLHKEWRLLASGVEHPQIGIAGASRGIDGAIEDNGKDTLLLSRIASHVLEEPKVVRFRCRAG